MFERILIVCVGNVCRSPMAAALMLAGLAGRDPGGRSHHPSHQRTGPATVPETGAPLAAPPGGALPRVDSAGLGALVGAAADPLVQLLLAERGLDLRDHRARVLTPAMVRGADLILVMEEAQRRFLVAREPAAAGKLRLLGHWTGTEIADPYLQPRAAYEATLAAIEAAVDAWLPRL